MKKSDLDILRRTQEMQRIALRAEINILEQKKQSYQKKLNYLNVEFIKQKPSLEDGPFLKYRAVENKIIQQECIKIDQDIQEVQSEIRESVLQSKSYDILKEKLLLQDKIKAEKKFEMLDEEYQIFKSQK